MSYYDILKVSRDAPPEVIKAAYRSLSQKHHPDKNGGSEESKRLMQLINEAYGVLSNPVKRKAYDAELDAQEQKARNQQAFYQQKAADQKRAQYEEYLRKQAVEASESRAGNIASFIGDCLVFVSSIVYAFSNFRKESARQRAEKRADEYVFQQQQARKAEEAFKQQQARKAEEEAFKQQAQQERTQRQQTQSHQDATSKVANRDNPGCLIILIITTVAIIIGTIIIFMESLSHTPNSAASGYAASEAFAASDADFASSDERFDESTTEPESLTASSAANEALEMLRQQELARQQAEQAERDRIAAEEQKQAELLSKQRKDCLQVARNIGYYETVASYCGLNPKRDLDSFTNEFNELACHQAVSDAEITEAAQRSERHLDTVIDNVTDQVAFCRKEYPFWSRVDNYQRY